MPSRQPKIVAVIGTRPEVIKMAPVINKLKEKDGWKTVVVCTAQHREMLDQMLEIFSIAPDVDLNIMTPNQALTRSFSRAIEGMGGVLDELKPDFVLVQGDTNTVFATALAAFYHRVSVGHVEAGLRTSDPHIPFPEEMNRRLTSVVSTLHFAPTARAVDNLRAEGIPAENIFLTGNTVVDALLWIDRKFSDLYPKIAQEILARDHRIVLVTAHRRENFGRRLREICEGLLELVRLFDDVEIVYPVHLNPAVRQTVFEVLGGMERIHLIEPLPYHEFVRLMSLSSLILTDSGGIQEEAPSFGKRVLVLRDETERPEAVEAGYAVLVGADKMKIVTQASHFLSNNQIGIETGFNPFGDGKAAERIVKYLEKFLNGGI
ncbi:MAG TPA: UDP-N-acetylglucosamine 2-epimerase (non-hydrolyzing) [candidate division WOR-3 bacterium]|uniref:UDP-N-acetylglucosamine 2-epimerase (non-hydrolyzing) n=1 Tax=candidate division WOR-3 bacterium TaxID=2052148 RepID=A0A7C1BE29_UNCW3|nr:UDP-N-acetylglucosamine 2-epimerase (non-hydrolyzing) [candidate division WOR-3 bacterium]